jgi:predicted restriction endonuclease
VKHLRASHIKPWRDATNAEKLSGFNGLLLAPHVDHLFDRGWISFSDSGQLLVANSLNREVLEEWSINPDHDAGRFHDEQSGFLEYHRSKVFQHT